MNRTHRALAMLVLSLALVGATSAVAAAQSTTGVEDQNDRLLRNLEAGQADQTQSAVEQVRAGERNFDLGPVVTVAPQSIPAIPGWGLDPLAVLLGLVEGLAGGAAAMAGWTAASRRRPHRAASAT